MTMIRSDINCHSWNVLAHPTCLIMMTKIILDNNNGNQNIIFYCFSTPEPSDNDDEDNYLDNNNKNDNWLSLVAAHRTPLVPDTGSPAAGCTFLNLYIYKRKKTVKNYKTNFKNLMNKESLVQSTHLLKLSWSDGEVRVRRIAHALIHSQSTAPFPTTYLLSQRYPEISD